MVIFIGAAVFIHNKNKNAAQYKKVEGCKGEDCDAPFQLYSDRVSVRFNQLQQPKRDGAFRLKL